LDSSGNYVFKDVNPPESPGQRPSKTCFGICKHPPRNTGTKSERDKNTCKYVDSEHKPRKKCIGMSKHPPRHTDKKSERDKNTYKYVDSDTKTEKDMHWNKQTPAQTHRQKE
jgi:hypothetical protein